MTGLIVDNFAGGGGASTGIEAALGRAVDIAINHDEAAIRMHEVNHPGTRHIRNNIWQIDPREVTGGQHVELAWFSPDCKHFSKAKGGKPREKSIRDLAWVVVLWAQRARPDVILLENVEEFRTWGPLCEEGRPIKDRAGETFNKWTRELRKAGYKIQWKELRACDYGAPTIRKRFFMIARRDGKPIVWPAPTHGKPDSPEVLSGKRKPWRTAAEIIDWSIPCPSIFERKKPLAENTLRRIAHGIMKFVVNNPSPFIVPLTHHGSAERSYGMDKPLPTVTGANRGEMALIETSVAPFATYAQHGGANRSIEDPLHTVTASKKDQNCVATAVLSPFYGDKNGKPRSSNDIDQPLRTQTVENRFGLVAAFMQKFAQNGKGYDPEEPLHTVMAGAPRHAVVCAHIEQANGGPNNENLAGRAADEPLSTVTKSGSQQRLVTSNLIKLRGTSDDHIRGSAVSVEEPVNTISSGGIHAAEVRAFLIKYYGTDQDPRFEEPLHTVTTKDRFGLVTVTIEGEEYVIIDIGMRMLSPRELFNAQGFPPDYIIDRDADGQAMTKTSQVARCGNSVCPPLSEALVRANFQDAKKEQVAA